MIKKAIWIPVLIGIVSGSLILAAALADFFIPLGPETSMGIGEIFTTLSAALGGPISAFITLLIPYSVVSLLNWEQYSEPRTFYITLADAAAHMCAMLVVSIGYCKLLYPRAQKTTIFLVGWWLTVGVYYYLAFLPLEVVLLNLVDSGFGASYSLFARDFFPEFAGTALITSLAWFAAPIRYRRPQWVKPQNFQE